jgi:hypothetical protein
VWRWVNRLSSPVRGTAVARLVPIEEKDSRRGLGIFLSVDPTKPGNAYKGHDFQVWQSLQPKPAPAPKPTSSVVVASTPAFPTVSSPLRRSDGLPAPYRGSNGARARGGADGGLGIAAALGEKSAGLALGVVRYVWPLKACIGLGERIVSAKPRGFGSVCCAP